MWGVHVAVLLFTRSLLSGNNKNHSIIATFKQVDVIDVSLQTAAWSCVKNWVGRQEVPNCGGMGRGGKPCDNNPVPVVCSEAANSIYPALSRRLSHDMEIIIEAVKKDMRAGSLDPLNFNVLFPLFFRLFLHAAAV